LSLSHRPHLRQDRPVTALELENLTKSYGDRKALDGATFAVRAGEILGFVGANGAGKTTAMRIVLGVLAADAGEVRWDGRPLDLETRRRIGYMPEERGLYPRMRVGEQLEYLARLHGLTPAAARAAAARWAETLGVAERLGDEVQKLSLGNQQRVQLAAALVHDPDVLVLDEPFSGLDPVAVDVMSGVLRERARAGVPVVFSSHQLDLVERLCDRVGIIRAGRMVATGTIDALRTTGRPRWVVDGPPDGPWLERVPGAHVVSRQGARTIVETPSDDAGQEVLRAALAVGPVHVFGPQRPSLTELFRDVVADGSSHAPATEKDVQEARR
jgi:ABC-2 type transport system ATP-binding protein